MDGQLVHFELPAERRRSGDGSSGESLFGWKFQAWDGPVEYHMLAWRPSPAAPIYPDSDSAGSGPIVYFGHFDDIDASIAKARDARRHRPTTKKPIPGIG